VPAIIDDQRDLVNHLPHSKRIESCARCTNLVPCKRAVALASGNKKGAKPWTFRSARGHLYPVGISYWEHRFSRRLEEGVGLYSSLAAIWGTINQKE
jgi:hypothetical protein